MLRSARHGLTWIDVLVILAIVVVVVGFLLPAVRSVREPANRMRCQNNLKQLMIALHSFESTGRSAEIPSMSHPDAHAGHLFPPGCLGPGATPEERLSWMVALLPYLEQGSLYQQFVLEKG